MRARKVVTKIVCACFSILILVLLDFYCTRAEKWHLRLGIACLRKAP